MTSWIRTLGVALAAVLVAQAPLSGHNGIAAFVTVTPGRPGAGQACQISVVAIGPTGALASARVTLIGEMTGHPMPPLRANLQPTVAKGRYAGEMTFTMAGPWKMTLEVDHLGETMWASFDLAVGTLEEGPGQPRRYDLEDRKSVV